MLFRCAQLDRRYRFRVDSSVSEIVAYCPHFGNTAPQREVCRHEYHVTGYSEFGGGKADFGPCDYVVRSCMPLVRDGTILTEGGYELKMRFGEFVERTRSLCINLALISIIPAMGRSAASSRERPFV